MLTAGAEAGLHSDDQAQHNPSITASSMSVQDRHVTGMLTPRVAETIAGSTGAPPMRDGCAKELDSEEGQAVSDA